MTTALERAQDAMRVLAAEIRPAQAMPERVRRRVRRRQARTVVTATTLVVVVVGASTAGALMLRSTVPDRPPPAPASTPWRDLPVGWTEFPPLPGSAEGAAYVWTGDRLIALGGSVPGSGGASADAFSLGPDRSGWTTLPPAPLPSLGPPPHAVWTGREAVFFGVGAGSWQGAAYDPAARRWRVIADPPIDPRPAWMSAWTGTELIVWGGGERVGPPDRTGAAYNPDADTWRRIADAPIGLNQGNAVWTGHQVVVFGSMLGPSNNASTQSAIGAEYLPETDSWATMPPSSLSPQADSAVWVNFGLLAWDYLLQAQVGDVPGQPGGVSWGDVRDIPLRESECYPDSALIENDATDQVFAWYCGQAALWNPADATWARLRGGPLDETVEVGSGTIPLYEGGTPVAAGTFVVVPMRGVTVSEQGEPCHGCAGSPHALWAFRPPSNAPTAAEVAPPRFDPADGWHTITTNPDPSLFDIESTPGAWAANVPFASEDLGRSTSGGRLDVAAWPEATIRSLGPDDVVITAWLSGRRGVRESPNANFPERVLPLQIADADARTSWEGQIAPNVPEYLLLANVDGRQVEVRIFFGTLDPGPDVLQAAQEELERLALPPPP